MKRLTVLLVMALMALCDAAHASASTCAAGSTGRLTIQNSCGDAVWLIETPPGAVGSAAAAQWDWFLNSSQVTQSNPSGKPSGAVAGALLAVGASVTFCVPDKGAPGGNFRFYMGCPSNNTSPFQFPPGCTIGTAAGDLAGVNTLFEPTFGCKPGLSGSQCAVNPSGNNAPIGPSDNVDVSAVNGYTLPVAVAVTQATCSPRQSTDASMLDLASCPGETSATLVSTDATQQSLIDQGLSLLTRDATGNLKACVAPFNWFLTGDLGSPANTSPTPASSCSATTIASACFYAAAGCITAEPVTSCPGASGPQQKVGPLGTGHFAIQNTSWVQQLLAMGYDGYTWQYGDGVGDQTCDWGGQITLTLCPNGGTPYVPNVLWEFSPATGNCTATGTGTPDNTTTFGSLFACQTANMRYTCQDNTPNDPFKVRSAAWQADAQATVSGTGQTYLEVQALKVSALQCAASTFTIPAVPSLHFEGGTFSIPECNYIFSSTGSACPATMSGSPALASPQPNPVAFVGAGRARKVGTGRDGGQVRLSGRFTAPRAIRLDQATLKLWRLLDEVGLGHGSHRLELTRRADEASLLPITLQARAGSKPNAAIYQTASGVRPSVWMEVKTRDPRTGLTEFLISVDRATILGPERCAGAPHPSTLLETRFSLHDAGSLPIAVQAKLHWECLPGELRMPWKR